MEQHAGPCPISLSGFDFLNSMPTTPDSRFRTSRTAVRVLLFANFLFFGLLVIPAFRHWADAALLALRDSGREDLAGYSIPAWILGSTFVATILFGHMFWKGGGPETDQAERGVGIEGRLLLVWWITLVGVCIYGYSLGTGG